ncbi:hypothetical protein GCM10022393_28870 [Aquimarina addita]|uniref:DinB-like domain-containing protein n=1 Tax=Aquimarina addita TaxID=870485 RepID=A0ABP6URN9_9FLAO
MDIEDSIQQLEMVFEGDPWLGTSVLKPLKKIPYECWNEKPENVAHSIAELVLHMIDWRIFVIEKLKDNQSYSIVMNSEMDWRKNVSIATETEKKECLTELINTQEMLITRLVEKPDSWLNEFVLGKDYTNEYMIMGVIQHDIYHLGQINLIYSQLNK